MWYLPPFKVACLFSRSMWTLRIIFVVIQSGFSTSSFPIHPCSTLGAKCFAPQGHEHSLYSPLTYLKFCIFPMHLELISMEFWVRLRFYFIFSMWTSYHCNAVPQWSTVTPAETPHSPLLLPLLKPCSQWLTLSLSSEMALTLPYFPGMFWILLAFFLL